MSVAFGNSESSCYAEVVEQRNRDQPSMSHVYLTGLKVSGSIGLVETDGNCVHVGDTVFALSICFAEDVQTFHKTSCYFMNVVHLYSCLLRIGVYIPFIQVLTD